MQRPIYSLRPPRSHFIPFTPSHSYDSLFNCSATNAFRGGEGREGCTSFDQHYLHANSNPGGRSTWHLTALCPCWLHLGDTGMKMHLPTRLPLCRYSGMAGMSGETPPFLLSFSCHMRMEGKGNDAGTPRLNLCHLPKLCSSRMHPI